VSSSHFTGFQGGSVYLTVRNRLSPLVEKELPMNRRNSIIAILLVALAVLVLAWALPRDEESPGGQPAPHAIDQSE
jgi:hypothetical protein